MFQYWTTWASIQKYTKLCRCDARTNSRGKGNHNTTLGVPAESQRTLHKI